MCLCFHFRAQGCAMRGLVCVGMKQAVPARLVLRRPSGHVRWLLLINSAFCLTIFISQVLLSASSSSFPLAQRGARGQNQAADYNFKPNQFREINVSITYLYNYIFLPGLYLKSWNQSSNNNIPLTYSAQLFFFWSVAMRMSRKLYWELDTCSFPRHCC